MSYSSHKLYRIYWKFNRPVHKEYCPDLRNSTMKVCRGTNQWLMAIMC